MSNCIIVADWSVNKLSDWSVNKLFDWSVNKLFDWSVDNLSELFFLVAFICVVNLELRTELLWPLAANLVCEVEQLLPTYGLNTNMLLHKAGTEISLHG